MSIILNYLWNGHFLPITVLDRISELESKLQNSELLLSKQMNEFQQKYGDNCCIKTLCVILAVVVGVVIGPSAINV